MSDTIFYTSMDSDTEKFSAIAADGYSIGGISFGDYEDEIQLENLISDFSDSVETGIPELTNTNGRWKYSEDVVIKEITEYLGTTYNSHYTSKDSKTQTLDLIESIGDAEAFCRSNAIKYLSRFGKKNGKSKSDILKAIHYCILLCHFSGVLKQPKGNYETF